MSNTLRELALSAKSRLKSGYWKEYYSNRDCDMQIARDKGINTGLVSVLYRQKLIKQFARHKLPYENENELYGKVYALVVDKGDELITDPIGRLIDRNVYDGLDTFNRQKYILNLSEAYRTIKDEILQEMEYMESVKH